MSGNGTTSAERNERRDLTARQRAKLDEMVASPDGEFLRIVGWDTAVAGPLLEQDFGRGPKTFAISPRGKRIERPGRRLG